MCVDDYSVSALSVCVSVDDYYVSVPTVYMLITIL